MGQTQLLGLGQGLGEGLSREERVRVESWGMEEVYKRPHDDRANVCV